MAAGAKTVHFKGVKTEQLSTCKPTTPNVPKEPDKLENMYNIQWPPYSNNDVERRINSVLGPLSLFAPYPHEDEPEETEIVLERPVTPINEEIKLPPNQFEHLSQYVKRRIAAQADVSHLTVEDQQSLADILMGEVNNIWPDIRKQIDDPFLCPKDNHELNRRISVHIVTVCEQLFHHFIEKAQVLNKRGIFSGPANMTRLKAQLAVDASKFLNILAIRRYIVADMRGRSDAGSAATEDYIAHVHMAPSPQTEPAGLSFKQLIQTSRPKSRMKKFKFRTMEQEAREISSNMPSLDSSKLMDLIAFLPERPLETPSQESEGSPSVMSEMELKITDASEEDASRHKVLLKRSDSLPNIQVGESLMEELGIEEDIRKDALSQYEIHILKRQSSIKPEGDAMKGKSEPSPGTREYLQQDLDRLLLRSEDNEQAAVDEDLPPLLQALTRSSRHDGKKKILEQQMKELEEKERRDLENQKLILKEPAHPQPDTLNTKLPNQMVVRTSDIRVSERVCMSSITIQRYSTIYNDLVEEIDADTVKDLDKNLFLVDEINEVYKEIMKTVPTDHLQLDDDVSIMPSAENITLSGVMASATLGRRKAERLINPKLQKEKEAPWGQSDPKEWVRTPIDPPKNFKGDDVFAPMTPNFDRYREPMNSPKAQNEYVPVAVNEKMSRTFASWMQWWKNTITSDDYMKYLSTQETDYMGALFHFYDSDDEEETEPATTTIAPIPGIVISKTGTRTTHSTKTSIKAADATKEKEKKMSELKTIKSEYKEGFWNVNTVLMGGLGKDPNLEGEDDGLLSARTRSADTAKSAKTLQERAAARQSAKIQEKVVREASQSRASKVTTLTFTSKVETEQSEESENEVILSPQDRLERVWGILGLPDRLRLDMAVKYSCDQFFVKLSDAIERWEKVTELIMKRETLLGKLEHFERTASDPNRFFEKGQKGSSVKRLEEAKRRSYFYKKIDDVDAEIKFELEYIRENFMDVITYKGRPYNEKMKWDRTEMLNWLQEERKQQAMKFESIIRQIPLKAASLDAIPSIK